MDFTDFNCGEEVIINQYSYEDYCSQGHVLVPSTSPSEQ